MSLHIQITFSYKEVPLRMTLT